jgi:hypothetical protein
MHACASHLSMVTYSHTPTPTLKISLYASIHFSAYDSTSKCIMQWACITSQYGHLKMDMRTFPRRPRCPHLHWASPFMYRGQYALMYTIQADVGACIKSDWGHFYMNMCTFPGVLDALTYTEHLPLWIEASTYDSTSKCIMQWACITSQHGHFKIDIRTFPGVLDALIYTEHLPLCIEASMRSGVYSSTSKFIMHAHASHPSMVTSQWICALSQASWTPSPTLGITLYV